jgi:V8-like Glu-specific endopeptidase
MKLSKSAKTTLTTTILLSLVGLSRANSSSNTLEDPQIHDQDADFNPQLRIINGDLAPPDAYPWFAKGQGCGASLVTPEFVITAAHCSSYRFDRLRIGAICTGNANEDGDNCGSYYEVRYAKQEFMPPGAGTEEYDVRLVQLTERSTIEPVEIDDGSLSNNYPGGTFLYVCMHACSMMYDCVFLAWVVLFWNLISYIIILYYYGTI